MKKFKLHIVREGREATEFEKEVLADEKDVEVFAPTCCEAVINATRKNPDYLVTAWEEIPEAPTRECQKRVKLDKNSFKSEVEWKSAQMDMDSMDFDVAMKLVELRGWKIAS